MGCWGFSPCSCPILAARRAGVLWQRPLLLPPCHASACLGISTSKAASCDPTAPRVVPGPHVPSPWLWGTRGQHHNTQLGPRAPQTPSAPAWCMERVKSVTPLGPRAGAFGHETAFGALPPPFPVKALQENLTRALEPSCITSSS